MLLQAVRDAQGADPVLAAEARRWLRGEGIHWAEALNIVPDRVHAWLAQLPALPYEQLTFFD
jgi:hypothetical protein